MKSNPLSDRVLSRVTKMRADGCNWAEIAEALNIGYTRLRRWADPDFLASSNAKAARANRKRRGRATLSRQVEA